MTKRTVIRGAEVVTMDRGLGDFAAAEDARHEIVAPRAYGTAPAASVHTPEYIDFLQIAAREWAKLPSSSAEVVLSRNLCRAMLGETALIRTAYSTASIALQRVSAITPALAAA